MAVAKTIFRLLPLLIAQSLVQFAGMSARAQGSVTLVMPGAQFDSTEALARIRTFLSEQEVIRVGVEGGQNNGHQSTAATVVQRLRELGFRGRIQVIYHSEQAARLEFLFPPFRAALGPFQSFPERRLEFHEVGDFHSRNHPEVAVGLVGATDYLIPPERLLVRNLLAFQPLNWWGRPAYLYVDQGFRDQDGNFLLRELTNLGFVHRIPSIDDPLDFIETDMAHTASLAAKIFGLRAMATNRRDEIAAVYGHSIATGRQLLDYVGGLSWAQSESPTTFRRGIVVPVFNAISREKWSRLRAAALLEPRLRDRAEFLDVSDVSLRRKIEAIQPGEILVVRVGPVAKRVFDYFMATSTIAPVVEGRNSANLMMLAGTPYLPSHAAELWHFSADLQEAESALGEIGLYAVLGMTRGRPLIPHDDTAFRSIGEFLVETRRPDSQISRRFEASHRALNPIRDDKIIRGLLTLIDRMAEVERDRRESRPQPVAPGTIRCGAMFAR